VRTPIGIGVVGLGYWGPNLARTFDELPQADVRWLCDRSPQVRMRIRSRYPNARATADLDDLLDDELLDAVVVATPSSTHAALVQRALEADKHVFVEKPLALTPVEAARLVAEAERRERCLMVGHVLLFHPAVRKLKELVDRGHLGDLYYLYTNRQNLGKVRQDENALWSLGAHDLSVLLYLLEDQPVEASARGECYVQDGIADVVFCYLKFATGISAHMHLSWLDPHKMRRLTAVGSERMVVLDDMETERKLTIYEKSATSRQTDIFGEYVQVSFGDIVSPRLPNDEPLRLECEHFLSAVRSPGQIHTGAREAVVVVDVLDALQRSLDRGGVPVPVQGLTPAPDDRVVSLPRGADRNGRPSTNQRRPLPQPAPKA
jgi:predicted dehydrogenase